MITTGVSILGQPRKTVARHARLGVAKHKNMVSSANFILDADHVGRILTFVAVSVSHPDNPLVHTTQYIVVAEVFPRQYDELARMSFCDIQDRKVMYLPALSVGRDVLGFTGVRPNGVCHNHIITDTEAASRLYLIRIQTGLGVDASSKFVDYQ